MSGRHEHETRTGRVDPRPSGTAAGADMTARMSGASSVERDAAYDRHGEHDEHRDRDVVRERHVDRGPGLLRSKTSAAAVFGLVFGLSALFCALTAILSPVAVVLGLIGLVVSIAGMKMAKRPGVTGRGVAIGGLVTSLLGLLLGAAVIGGAAVLVNDESRLDQLQERIDDLRADLPSGSEVVDELPAG